MTASLAMTISLVLLSILALEQPFGGITRVEPHAFDQLKVIFDTSSHPGVGRHDSVRIMHVTTLKHSRCHGLQRSKCA
jgi:hypothetical protein